ncbi:MAG: hypothetical protein QM658_15750 [Gordonia sp. (in: high G+C Gram-positive bacteria)]
MRKIGKSAAQFFALAALAVTMTACTVDGTPQRGPVVLDTGKYSTKLAPEFGTATSDNDIALVRATRLAGNVIFPEDIDSSFTHFSMPTSALVRAKNINMLLPDADKIPANASFKYGFSTTASEPPKYDRAVNHAVFVYANPQAATAAAQQFADASAKDPGETRNPIAGMPSATQAVQSPVGADGLVTEMAFTPVGDKVIYTWVKDTTFNRADASIVRAYQKQKSMLDAMPVDDDLERDPAGLLRATIEDPDNDTSLIYNTVWDQRGEAQNYGNRPQAYQALKDAGIEHTAKRKTQVYEAEDQAGAKSWAKYLSDSFMGDDGRKADSPQDLDSVPCYVASGRGACFVVVGKYVGEIYGKDLKDAQQQAAAQYELLKQLPA